MNSPFDKLKAMRDQLPPGPEPAATPLSPAATSSPVEKALQGRVVVRHERKGRGGKTVTLVQGLVLPPAELETFARDLKKGLGCGATIEEGMIVLQGDIVDRVVALLEKRGARKVVRGST